MMNGLQMVAQLEKIIGTYVKEMVPFNPLLQPGNHPGFGSACRSDHPARARTPGDRSFAADRPAGREYHA
jgi:hypothetical protein